MNTKLSMILLTCLLYACAGSPHATDIPVQKISSSNEESAFYTIKRGDVPIRIGPGSSYARLLNKKATAILHKKEYCAVDQSVRVQVLIKKQNWSKIRVVEPAWLADSYVGWIPTEVLITTAEMDQITTINLDPADYKILETGHQAALQNFHVWLKRKKINKDYVYSFTKAFRKTHCTMQCNVLVYDTDAVTSLLDVYPLKGKDYLKMADHLVSISTFDAVELRDWYPYQDFHYRELGGSNWKKDP